MGRARIPLLASLLLLAALVAALWPVAALANGQPLSAYLSYMPEVCNWGVQDATGDAMVDIGEGRVEVTARGLPALGDGTYEAWLVTPGLAQWVSVGRFAASGGPVNYSVRIDEIPALDYQYLVITVEPAEGDSGEPSGSNVIAGAFGAAAAPASVVQAATTVAAPEGDAATPTAAATAAPESAAQPEAEAPEFLPVSGAPASGTLLALSNVLITAGLALLASGSLVLASRR